MFGLSYWRERRGKVTFNKMKKGGVHIRGWWSHICLEMLRVWADGDDEYYLKKSKFQIEKSIRPEKSS